jgi:hypothetical protein
MLHHQPDCAPVRWYRERVEKANGAGKKTFIVALRAQAAHRALALCQGRRGAGGHANA